MAVSFAKVRKGAVYSRNALAELWGYSSYHAIARGVVTPRNDNRIILFVTEEKQVSQEQYADHLSGDVLKWESPTDHFAEDRICKADITGDEIHLFHRKRHHAGFVYCGRLKILSHTRHVGRPSRFTFQVQ